MFGAGWNRGGGANGEPVTEAGLCNAMNFNNLENAVGRLSDQNAPTATLNFKSANATSVRVANVIVLKVA